MTFELASKYGTPYYDNQIPAYRGAVRGYRVTSAWRGTNWFRWLTERAGVSVKRIQDIFDAAARMGRRIDTFGAELAYYDGRTPSVDFETQEASLRPFHGVMRRRYSGPSSGSLWSRAVRSRSPPTILSTSSMEVPLFGMWQANSTWVTVFRC